MAPSVRYIQLLKLSEEEISEEWLFGVRVGVGEEGGFWADPLAFQTDLIAHLCFPPPRLPTSPRRRPLGRTLGPPAPSPTLAEFRCAPPLGRGLTPGLWQVLILPQPPPSVGNIEE